MNPGVNLRSAATTILVYWPRNKFHRYFAASYWEALVAVPPKLAQVTCGILISERIRANLELYQFIL